MSRLFTLVVLLCVLFNSSAKAQKQRTPPPGTVYLKDNLFIDKSPISNAAYKEFLFAVQNFWSLQTHEAISTLPLYGLRLNENAGSIYITDKKGNVLLDSANTKPDALLYAGMKISDKLVVDQATNLTMEYYGRASYYNQFPVVYITYEQAEMFCKWRSDWVMLHYAIDSKSSSDRKKYYSKVTYRLISEDEWKYAFDNKAEIMLSDFGTRNAGSQHTYVNYKNINSRSSDDNFNIYANNFAELLIAKKSMIGVLWDDATQSNTQIVTKSYAPASNAGFRCICEVEE